MSDERVVVTVAHETTEKVYQIVLQSQKKGISIDQIARQFNGNILVPYYVAQLVIETIKWSISAFTSPILYVAVESNINAPV